MKKIKVEITFLEDVLGSGNADPDIHRKFIAENAPKPEQTDEEVEALPDAEEAFENKLTVFPRMKDGRAASWDYQWKGFFKDACGMLKKVPGSACANVKAYKKEIDGLVFVTPRMIPFEFEGDIGICQRPLRGQTAQGERIALASSESIPAGARQVFEISLLLDSHEKFIRECLDYGQLRGFSQWRNSGKGRFAWREIKD